MKIHFEWEDGDRDGDNVEDEHSSGDEENDEDAFGKYYRIPQVMYEIGERFMLPRLQKYVVDFVLEHRRYDCIESCQDQSSSYKPKFYQEDLSMIEAALHKFRDLVKPLASAITYDLKHSLFEKEWHGVISRDPELAIAVTVELTESFKWINQQLQETWMPPTGDT